VTDPAPLDTSVAGDVSASAPDVVRVQAPTRRGREMRQRLVDAAAHVFAERGYRETRVSDITQSAGTAQGNFYRHFTNKNDVLLAVLADPLEELLACANPPFSAGTAATEAALVDWNTHYFTVYAAHSRIYRVMREAAAAGQDAGFAQLWKGQRQRFVDRVAEWLDALHAAGHLDPVADTALMAEALVSMREQLSYVHLGLAAAPPTPGHIAQMGETVGRLWFRCLGLTVKRSPRRQG
jgi:AcrR family transcriptional regulator